jgi:hypothetical protein
MIIRPGARGGREDFGTARARIVAFAIRFIRRRGLRLSAPYPFQTRAGSRRKAKRGRIWRLPRIPVRRSPHHRFRAVQPGPVIKSARPIRFRTALVVRWSTQVPESRCVGGNTELSGSNSRTGRVAEWFKAPVLKTGVPARVPWVRIPPLPPDHQQNQQFSWLIRFNIQIAIQLHKALRAIVNCADTPEKNTARITTVPISRPDSSRIFDRKRKWSSVTV